MATRINTFSLGEYYHIYNRGTDSRDIFIDDADRRRFIKLLYVANGNKPFIFRDFPIGLPYVKFDRGEIATAIGAYCLMNNHFHLLLKESVEGGITNFMNKLLTSYSSYFNKKYKRSGRLFQGTFKSKHLDNDEYLKYIFSYIHLNPVKLIDSNWKENGIQNRENAKKFLGAYAYSTYLDYIGIDRIEVQILAKEAFPEYFTQSNEFETFINDWLTFNPNNPTT